MHPWWDLQSERCCHWTWAVVTLTHTQPSQSVQTLPLLSILGVAAVFFSAPTSVGPSLACSPDKKSPKCWWNIWAGIGVGVGGQSSPLITILITLLGAGGHTGVRLGWDNYFRCWFFKCPVSVRSPRLTQGTPQVRGAGGGRGRLSRIFVSFQYYFSSQRIIKISVGCFS